MTGDTELYAMSSDPRVSITVTGRVRTFAGRRLLVLPVRAPLGRSRGHRVRVAIGTRPARVRVALVVTGQLALRPARGEVFGQLPVRVSIRPVPPRRRRSLPADLVEALTAARLDLSELPDHEVDQMLLMIGESATGAVRAARIQAALVALHARSGHA
jgi:hypothetical protein